MLKRELVAGLLVALVLPATSWAGSAGDYDGAGTFGFRAQEGEANEVTVGPERWLLEPALGRAYVARDLGAPLSGDNPPSCFTSLDRRTVRCGASNYHDGWWQVFLFDGDDKAWVNHDASVDLGPGADTVVADGGSQSIWARDRQVDHITCGGGHDFVFADTVDVIAADCDDVELRA